MVERPRKGVCSPLEASLSHHKPPIASTMRRLRRSTPVGRVAAWFIAGVALASLSACGSGDESADPSPETLIDAVTGEAVEAPDDFTLTFDPPADDVDGATVDDAPELEAVEPDEPEADESSAPDQATDPLPDPADEPVDEGADGGVHPLETVVIDTVVADPEAAPVLDEAAALACANTEFAMDALIEGSPDRGERFTAAAEWAAQSAHDPVRAFAERLAADPVDAEANELVVAVLETCAAAGYEL
jgi:type IV secretory pathway VirB10-like protein